MCGEFRAQAKTVKQYEKNIAKAQKNIHCTIQTYNSATTKFNDDNVEH